MGLDYTKIDNQVLQKLTEYRNTSKTIRENEEKQQLQRAKTKDTLKEISFHNISYKNVKPLDKPIKFENTEYSFIEFKDCKFGRTGALNIDNMYHVTCNFWNVTFENCFFENVYFENSHFWGCKFLNCIFDGLSVYFDNCCFRHMTLTNPHQPNVNYSSTEFAECNLTNVHWVGCLADYLVFQNNTFILCDFSDCEMPNCIFDGNGFYSTVVNNSNTQNLYVTNISNADIEFHFTNSQKVTNLHKNIYISKVNKNHLKDKDDYRDTAKMYYTLVEYLQLKNLDVNYMSEYRYLTNYYSMCAKDKITDKIWDRFSWITCGFGEKISRVFLCFISIILIPAIGYLFTGLNVGGTIIKYTIVGGDVINPTKFIKDFAFCLHFSIVTFSTVGYGNITPCSFGSYFISAIQIILGILFVAIFTSLMLKKVIK